VAVSNGNSMSTRRRPKLISNIDVAAFASVLVVLMAVWMLPTGLPSHGVTADLPKVAHPISMPHSRREDAITITVLHNGDIFFGKDFVRGYRFSERIRERVRNGSEPTIYIRADARCKYLNVKGVLDEIHSSGVEHVVFLVDQRRVTQ